MNTIRLFITDDHYMIVEGIRSLFHLEERVEWMGHAMTAESCLAFLATQQPDVILMDINLPDKSGIDLCREVKQKYPAIHVIGLSSFNQQSLIGKMIESGASGYVLKNATREELKEAIETVVQGKPFLSPEAFSIMSDHKGEQTPVITRREKEVLSLIADGLTNSEIGDKLFISTTTVDTHRKNLLTKLEAKNTASLIRKALFHHLI
jgi:DNA-binding NarL/FixJ family response regulator